MNPVGVDDSTIHVAVVFPGNQKLAEMLRRTTQAYFEKLNRQGGIYRRSLSLLEPYSDDQAYFCVLDMSMQPSNSQAANQIALAIISSDASAKNRCALYQHPLINNMSQQKSLLQAVDRQGLQAISIAKSGLETVLQQLTEMSQSGQLSRVLIHRQSEIDLVSLLKLLSTLNLGVNIITDSAAMAVSGLAQLTSYKGMIYPPSPLGLDWGSSGGRRQLLAMVTESGDSNRVPTEFSDNLSSRMWALALHKLLITAVQQSGLDLTTGKFLQALQSQIDLQMDSTPPISYSAIRRVGSDVVDLPRVH